MIVSSHPRALTLIATAALALLLSGCGSQDEAAAGGDTLYEKFGLPDYSDPDTQASFAEEERGVEEAIAECMIDQGFEYKPVIYDSGDQGATYSEEDAVESARRYGLGVSLQFNNPDYDAEVQASSDEFVDPNQEYIETLSEAEMQAFYEAMDGTPEEQAQYETTEVDPESGETYTTIEGAGAGCRGDAQRSVGSDDQAVYEALEPFQTEISERVDADPRFTEAKKEWSACMSDKGYEYENEEAVYEYAEGPMTEQLTEILGADPYGDPMADMSPEEQEAFFADKSETEIQEFFDSHQDRVLEGADLEALSALQEEERNLAVATTECSQSNFSVYEEVYKEIEAAYLAENADRISQAVAELEQAEPSPSRS